MNERFWLVWRDGGNCPAVKHNTIGSAKSEAERLARQQGGCKFHVLELVATCVKNDVSWANPDGDELPF